jgi:GntR family transcriptional regulator
MEIEVDTSSPTPHYEQIRKQITDFVLTGSLEPGTRLPAIRQLAGHLGLSNGAVARAYKELEREGTVTTNGKKGTIIAARDASHPSVGSEPERARVLGEAASQYAMTAHSLGYKLEAAQSALQQAMGTQVPAPAVAGR